MRTILVAGLLGAVGAAALGQRAKHEYKDTSVETYESLATAIISLNQAEKGLVQGILTHYLVGAQHALEMAAGASGDQKKSAIERAGTQITHIANEGDKAIQAVKQRLVKAGHHHHHHHADDESQEDYIWINPKEKKQFVDLAQRVARMGADASSDDLAKAGNELNDLFTKAIAPE